MLKSGSASCRRILSLRSYNMTTAVVSTTPVLSDSNNDEFAALASLQRANSTNPAVSYLVKTYEATRDDAVKATLHRIDQFLLQNRPANLPVFTRSLVQDFYRHLQPVPWLQFHSPAISFIQFILNDATGYYLDPVAHSTQMSALGNFADQVAPELSVLDLSIILHDLLLLGLPKSHHIVRQFFDRIGSMKAFEGEEVEDDRLLLFGEIGKITRLMGTRNCDEMRTVMAALSATVRSKITKKPSLQTVTSLLGLVNSRMPLNVSDEMAVGMFAMTYLKETSGKKPLSPRFFSHLFAWLSQYRGSVLSSIFDSSGLSRRLLMDLVYAGMSPLSKTLSDVEIAEVVSELKRGHCYPGRLRMELASRALLLCSGSFDRPLDIRLLSNSFYALDHTCDPHLIRFFTDKFADHLDNADVLLISNIAENLQHVQRSVSVEFRDLFLSHVERLSPGIVSHMTRLGRVLQFLETIPPHDIPPAFNTRFCSELVNQLGKSESRRLANQMIFPYLIANFANNMPDQLYQRLLSILPQFNLVALEKVLQAIRNAPVSDRQSGFAQKGQQLRTVRAAVYKRVSDLVESKTLSADETKSLSIAQLFRTARILLRGTSPSVQAQLPAGDMPTLRQSFSSIMETLGKSLDSISPANAYQLSDLILSGSYYNEHLLQRLEDFVTRDAGRGLELSLPLLLHIIRAMAAVAYEPVDGVLLGNTVSDVVLAVLNSPAESPANAASENSAILSTLRIGNGLATMRCYPPHLLGRIFSPVFLEQVDHLLAETKTKTTSNVRQRGGRNLSPASGAGTLHDHVRETLMRLNRTIVLECTEMQPITDSIPWFHSSYGRSSEILSQNRDWGFKQEVRDRVEQLVAQRSDYFLLSDQITPFYHFIDFELMPVEPNGEPQGSSITPVAVILLSSRQFVSTSSSTPNRLRGSVRQSIRQLEILGYRVVALSPNDWVELQAKSRAQAETGGEDRAIARSLWRLIFGNN